MTGDPLDRISALAGIERVYHDMFGERREVADDTIRAIADAMGLRADEVANRRHAPVEPVYVCRQEDGPPEIAIILPAGGGTVAWRLIGEDAAERAGEIEPAMLDIADTFEADGRRWERRRLRLPAMPLGYHRLTVAQRGSEPFSAETLLIVVPRRAYLPPGLDSGPGTWGISVQLYALRSCYDWGIGDFGDLAELIRHTAAAGGAVVGLNPLHALYLDEPERASPYSPNSRLFLNPLYIDVEAVPDYAECAAARTVTRPDDAAAPDGAALIDYPAVASRKRRALDLLFESFRERHLAGNTARSRAFRAFQRRGGQTLRRFALFQCLRETRGQADPAQHYWRNWPEPLRDPASRAVARFAAANRHRIEFFEYLQWIADGQLGDCAAAAREAGLSIGLYRDMAVGVDAGAADAWAAQDGVVAGWSLGAPPDDWSRKGQDWGLAPLNPLALRRARYRPFVELLRANMRHAGALRIDHVLGLWRTFWIRHGEDAARGAYVRFPFADLVGILALESHRHRCIVIGEDLGTVPDGLRTALDRAGILSYRLLYFEQESDSRFRRPADYPRLALVAVGTHDLPTLSGYWRGADIELRDRFGLLGSADQVEAARRRRVADREGLAAALRAERLIEDGVPDAAPVAAAYLYLARSPGRILMMHLEDALGVVVQVNVPGTVGEHPNWRRRLPLDLAAIFADPRVESLCRALNRERPDPRRSLDAALSLPLSTYRLQFSPRFTLADAVALVPYLADLGISHVYASPLLKARPGSEHGYDITDHNALNPEIGEWDDFVRFTDALRDREMGLILDFVPNHMGIGKADNAWWLDVLESGQSSVYGDYFDIDWTPYKAELRGKVLVPLLGDHYGTVLERGELVLRFAADEGSLSVWYHEHRLPLRPRSYAAIIRRQLAQLDAAAPATAGLRRDLASLADAFDRVRRSAGRRREEARRRVAALKGRLAALCRDDPAAAAFMAAAAGAFNGKAGDASSFRLLHGLLERQHYRLAFWRAAADEINYRRFFDINELAAIRMEQRPLFDVAHRLIGRMIAEGRLQGLRLDHVDGLFDPETYFRRLQDLARARRPAQPGEAAPFYVVIEKILAHHESLRSGWPIAGTTGYEFAALTNGLLVDAAAEKACDAIYREAAGATPSFDDVLLAAKDTVIETLLAGEINVLANELDRISERHWGTRDYTMPRLRAALKAVVRHFPTYRTYLTGRRTGDDDRRDIDWAISRARRGWRGPDREIFDFVHDALTGDLAGEGKPFRRADVMRFAMRFQQYTGPIMAKSFEDTAFYRYFRLVSLNEVGGDPRQFGVSPAAFHHANRQRARQWPHTLLATATHDTKRGEDTRARIDVLSEIPEEWRRRVARWSELNRFLRHGDDETPAPSRNDEYLLYQTLVGTWPVAFARGDAGGDALSGLADRVERYIIKAVREARQASNWDNPDDAYENACLSFVRGALSAERANPFLADFSAFAERTAFFGMLNGLVQTILRLTVPGVPDTYRGGETWDLSLVDPDNRRPVDFAERLRLLRDVAAPDGDGQAARTDRVRGWMAQWPDGRIKLHILHTLLHLRRRRPALFLHGGYEPLAATGALADHVIAFHRRHRGEQLLVVTGRLFVAVLGPGAQAYDGASAWGETAIAVPPELGGRWREALTGARYAFHPDREPACLRIASLLRAVPGAVLVRERP